MQYIRYSKRVPVLRIKVRFYGIAYDKVGLREWRPEIGDDSTISDLINAIMEEFPDTREMIYDAESKYLDYLAISVNNWDIQGLDGLETVLKDGDTVFVMPPIGGG